MWLKHCNKGKPSWFLFQSYPNCFQQDLILAYLSASAPLPYFTALPCPCPSPSSSPSAVLFSEQLFPFKSFSLELPSRPDLSFQFPYWHVVFSVSFIPPLQYTLFTKLFTAEQFIAVTQASVHINRWINHHICINYLKSTRIRYILALVGTIYP